MARMAEASPLLGWIPRRAIRASIGAWAWGRGSRGATGSVVLGIPTSGEGPRPKRWGPMFADSLGGGQGAVAVDLELLAGLVAHDRPGSVLGSLRRIRAATRGHVLAKVRVVRER